MPRPVRKVTQTLYSLALILVLAYGGMVGALYLFQRQILYQPWGTPDSPSANGVGEMQVVEVQTADGLNLVSWYAPAPADRPTVAYFCGNAGHIGFRAFKARQLIDAGLGVLLVGYRGFGGNPGKPSEEGLYADGRAALGFLESAGIPMERIVLYGESLGTGVAVRLAAERAPTGPVAAVVLETPYTSIAEVAGRHYPFVPARTLLRDRFDSLSRIAGIKAPLLVLHARDDAVIPFELAEELFSAAAEPKETRWFVAGGHEGLFAAGAARDVIAFIEKFATAPVEPR